MENTFIPELLDGSESGQFLALDLGGTNFRVILLSLEGGKIRQDGEVLEYYTVEETLRLGGSVNGRVKTILLPDLDLGHICSTSWQPASRISSRGTT